MRHPGFVTGSSNTRVVENGTFINSQECFPHLGYAREFELQDPNERRQRGLEPVERLPKLEDEAARGNNQLSAEADWIDFATTVSTSADQVALAPGYLEREWREGGRRHFRYRMDRPILAFWAYLSGRWAVARDRWQDVAIEVYHHTDHPYNVRRMIEAVKKSLDHYAASFSPYQHRQVRIVEFPDYASFARSFPNTIPYSERIGFIARLDDSDDIDYVFYVTAHEVAHQWWAHQLIGAGVQGGAVLTETLSQYSALMVMEREYGRDHMRRFLKYELDRYLSGRGGERIEELPLERAENQPYIHYNRGSVVMYALRDAVGEEALNAALGRFLAERAFLGPPYPTTRDLLAHLEPLVPPDRPQLIADLFETITLHDHRAVRADHRRGQDGRWQVRLDVASAKFGADGRGREGEVPVDDWVDVAVFGAGGAGAPPEGRVLGIERHHLAGPATTIELAVDEEPVRVGVDPIHKLVDRNPDNNLVRSSAAGGAG